MIIKNSRVSSSDTRYDAGGSILSIQDGVTLVQSSSPVATMSPWPKVMPPFIADGRPPVARMSSKTLFKNLPASQDQFWFLTTLKLS